MRAMLRCQPDAFDMTATRVTRALLGDTPVSPTPLSGAASTVEVWLDGSLVTGLSNSATAMVATSIAQLQIGDTATGTWDALFDDAGFGTSRLGPNTDLTPPSVPTGITATAASGFAVTVTWGASTDNTGVTGYNVYRDGSFLASAGATTLLPSMARVPGRRQQSVATSATTA